MCLYKCTYMLIYYIHSRVDSGSHSTLVRVDVYLNLQIFVHSRPLNDSFYIWNANFLFFQKMKTESYIFSPSVVKTLKKAKFFQDLTSASIIAIKEEDKDNIAKIYSTLCRDTYGIEGAKNHCKMLVIYNLWSYIVLAELFLVHTYIYIYYMYVCVCRS